MISAAETSLAAAAFVEAAASAGQDVTLAAAHAGITAAAASISRARVQAALESSLSGERPAPALNAEDYRKLLAQQETVSLKQYRAMEAYDRNVFWRLETGHIENLLDSALEHLDILAAALEAAAPAGTGQ